MFVNKKSFWVALALNLDSNNPWIIYLMAELAWPFVFLFAFESLNVDPYDHYDAFVSL